MSNPPPDRAELERLDRETLIARAETAGVSRAQILTRPELVDELLVRSATKDDPRISRARGFFGKARDLLARVIERGLHLPEAADRLRRATTPPPPPRSAQPALPTVTLAEIYAAQGHRGRAIETLKRVLDHEPEHGAARILLKQLADEAATGPHSRASGAGADGEEASSASTRYSEPPPSVATTEPSGFLDDDPLPWRYDVDECVAIPVDPTTLFVYWEIRDETLAHVRRNRHGGTLSLRVLVITANWEGPQSTTTDIDVGEPIADWFIRDLPAGAIVRVAVGWRQGGVFLPIAHSSAIETPPDAPSPIVAESFFAWALEGLIRIPVASTAEAVALVMGRRAARLGGAAGALQGEGGTLGASTTEGGGPPQGSSEHAYP